jgi:hypothetical protein
VFVCLCVCMCSLLLLFLVLCCSVYVSVCVYGWFVVVVVVVPCVPAWLFLFRVLLFRVFCVIVFFFVWVVPDYTLAPLFVDAFHHCFDRSQVRLRVPLWSGFHVHVRATQASANILESVSAHGSQTTKEHVNELVNDRNSDGKHQRTKEPRCNLAPPTRKKKQ